MSNEERIAVLELQYRNMKRVVLGVAAVITVNFVICSLIAVGYFVTITNVPDVVQAKKFEVVNGEGQTLVALATNLAGEGRVTTFDGKGNSTSTTPHSTTP